MNKSFKLAFKALATLINLTYYYCHKDKAFFDLVKDNPLLK